MASKKSSPAPAKQAIAKPARAKARPTGSASRSAGETVRVAPDRQGSPATMTLEPAQWLVPATLAKGAERRTKPRASANFTARLYGGNGRGTYLEAQLTSRDVSLSGVFLASTFFLPIDTPVRVEFDVPAVGRVAAEGRVARVQHAPESGIGVEFARFAEGSLEALISVFIADEVRTFVESYCRKRRGERDTPTPTSLLHGILAWEIHRSSSQR